ncbi:MAG: DUF5704 domain-containing protein [bacterium]|nr:DUF5704 domain-containing protein [bacterium]
MNRFKVFLFTLILILGCLLTSGLRTPRDVYGQSEKDLYRESLRFDSEGNLLMTTHDKKASGTVRYRTIGWTIRPYPGDDLTVSARIRLESNGQAQPDPEDASYVYTYFICGKEQLYAQLAAADKDWAVDLFSNGGYVKLDAIMTVVENEKPTGSMTMQGELSGEVYTSYEGIAAARAWSDKMALKTHFNKQLYVTPNPLLVGEPEKTYDEDEVHIQYGKKELQTANTITLTSVPESEPQFDTKKGIPTGEELAVSGQLQKYYYDATIVHCHGTVPVPVEMSISYTLLVQTEDGIEEETITSHFTYYVSRPYSYYRIKQLDFYAIKQAYVENEALPVRRVEFQNIYEPGLTIEQNRSDYITIPTFYASAYGGVLGMGGGLSGEQLRDIAEGAAGDVRVRNDSLSIDGELLLDGSIVQKETTPFAKQEGERICKLESRIFTISHRVRNHVYDTRSIAQYQGLQTNNEVGKAVKNVHPVVVHTPVVCKGGVTDDRMHNQQSEPTNFSSLVLGRQFSVGISTVGFHKEQTGYGYRDYAKYVKACQVQFPFEVYENDRYYPAGSWITLSTMPGKFYLPLGVKEGDYEIRYRVLAKNIPSETDEAQAAEHLANLQLEHYIATDEMSVTVMGRIYDLAMTDIIDYPRWQQVFHTDTNSATGYRYWVGPNDLEGNERAERRQQGIVPLVPGSHPYNPSARAVGMGYCVRFELKSIGDLRFDSAQIHMTPSYYYISRDGRMRIPVNLYQKENLKKVYLPVTLTAENRTFIPVNRRNVSDESARAQSVQIWKGSYQLSPDLYLVDKSVNLDQYIRLRGGRIGMRDPVFLRDGYLLVNFDITGDSGTGTKLSYSNCQNAANGYCNMWSVQGFSYVRALPGVGNFQFMDGDFLLFDTKYHLQTDYESWGTH